MAWANSPLAHFSHVLFPDAGWARPGLHGRQYAFPASACAYPDGHAWHVSWASQAPPASENLPAAHGSHEALLVWPSSFLPCLPGGQLLHNDSWATPVPLDQRPNGQPLHVSTLEAPSACSRPSSSEYRPGSQAWHPAEALKAPGTGPNMPRGQLAQSRRGWPAGCPKKPRGQS